MRSPTNHLGLITATLLLSLTSSLQLPGRILGISGAMATSEQQLHREQFELAGNIPPLPILSSTDLQEELEKLQQILVNQRENRNRLGEANTLNKMGVIYVLLAEYDQALELHQQALLIYQELDQYQSEAETIGYIGNAYFQAGEYRQVEELFRQKLESNRQIGDQGLEPFIFDVMHRYLKNEWRLQAGFYAPTTKVERFHQRDLSWQEILAISELNLFINRKIGDSYHEAIALHSIGWSYRNLGDYQQSLYFYQQALDIATESSEQHFSAFVLIEIGLLYIDLAKYEEALKPLQQSLVILENDSANGPADLKHFALNQIGLVYKNREQYEKALQICDQALDATRSATGSIWDLHNILNNCGEVYFQMGRYDQALAWYREAKKHSDILGDPGAKGFILNSIASAYTKMGDYTQALETYRQALALFQELNALPGERTTLSNIGALFEQQNQPELAIVFYKEAVNITETIRQNLNTLTIEEQKAYTETVADTYRRLADLLLSQGRILEAQQVLELLKVQELRNFTKDTRAGGEETTGITTNPTEAEILSTHGSLIALGRKIEECQQCEQRSQLLDQREVIAQEFEENVQSLKQIIRDRLDKDQAFLDPNQLGGNAEAIVSAQPGTVLIYPLVLEDKLWILWAASGGIISIPVVSE
ncbi:MAG: tetratricopeptide repeat protein [Symploca sp. SIO2E6]|nr:tetratricopeptide repeat protein [Symploca sp. SIO2E6]